ITSHVASTSISNTVSGVLSAPSSPPPKTHRRKSTDFPDDFARLVEDFATENEYLFPRENSKRRSRKHEGVGWAHVIFNCAAEGPDELNLKEGDIIKILAKDVSGWWAGELNGVTGLFPSN